VARSTHRTHVLPAPRPRRTLPQRAVRVLVLERDGRILFEQRPPVGIWGGLLSLPELALEDDLDAALRNRFAVTPRASRALPPLRHGFTHFGLTLHPQWIEVGDARRAGEPAGTWLTRDAALAAALPAPIKRLLCSLARR
jgi:A/G-specific adenine glycosylase